MPSVRTTIALCVPGRAARRRAVAAVASYSDVVPKGSKSARAPFKVAELAREILTLVEAGVEREERHFVLALAELRQQRGVGLPGHRDFGAELHAAAHVDQDRTR